MALLVAAPGCVCPFVVGGGPPAKLIPVAAGALPEAPLAIVRGDAGRVTAKVAGGAEAALEEARCPQVVTQRTLFHRWPGYPRALPIPLRGRYHPEVEITRAEPKVATTVAGLAGAGYVALLWAGDLEAITTHQTTNAWYDQTVYIQVYGAGGRLLAYGHEVVEAEVPGSMCSAAPESAVAPKIDEALAAFGKRLAGQLRGLFGTGCAGAATAAQSRR